MIILIPMAGAGSRFSKNGYKIPKPILPTKCRKTGIERPMVVQSISDLPYDVKKDKLIIVDRAFDGGVYDHQREITKYFPNAVYKTLTEVTNGQATTCLSVRDYFDKNEDLLISACDNGIEYNHDLFYELKKTCDCIVFSFRNHEMVLQNPKAYGWLDVDLNGNVIKASVKVPMSSKPMNDHAIVGTFWFKESQYFVDAANKMIEKNDKVNGEYYVDQVINHVIDQGKNVKVLEVDRYLCYGTPTDYQNYNKTVSYWQNFIFRLSDHKNQKTPNVTP